MTLTGSFDAQMKAFLAPDGGLFVFGSQLSLVVA
jgi:hypothetical protein